MKAGKDAIKIFDSLDTDSVSGWLVQSSENISEPSEVRKWRNGIDKDGNDTCVVSLHNLSCQSIKVNGSNDRTVFDRWMELLGQPYLPRSGDEITKLQYDFSKKIGQKYQIFQKREEKIKIRRETN